MKLHLGVIDIPYSQGSSRSPKKGATTGDVADILEDKYHVMEHFWQSPRGQKIADAVVTDMADFMADRMGGSGENQPSFIAAMSVAKTEFVEFIDSREMDGLGYPGIPTKAALNGVNHRFLRPYAKNNPARPSFRDTGTYEDAFTAWMEA
jgi:hypothetical protein